MSARAFSLTDAQELLRRTPSVLSALLEALDLGTAELQRTGRHPELGVVTARQLLATWVVHDQGHLAQVARVLAKQYRDEVGPWRQYLPVLDR